MGTEGQKTEKEGRAALTSHCIPTSHILVHIWLQYTQSLLLTIPNSISHTHKIGGSLTRLMHRHVCGHTNASKHAHPATFFFFLCVSLLQKDYNFPLPQLIKLLPRAALVTHLGGQRYSKPPHFLGDSALLHVPVLSRGKLDPNIQLLLTHRRTGSTEKTKSEDVCGPSAGMHIFGGEGNANWRTKLLGGE